MILTQAQITAISYRSIPKEAVYSKKSDATEI